MQVYSRPLGNSLIFFLPSLSLSLKFLPIKKLNFYILTFNAKVNVNLTRHRELLNHKINDIKFKITSYKIQYDITNNFKNKMISKIKMECF